MVRRKTGIAATPQDTTAGPYRRRFDKPLILALRVSLMMELGGGFAATTGVTSLRL
jgi:hypothetical protein